jgi:hypothetical protein
MPGWETLVVGIVVGVALLWGLRAVWQAVRRGSVCSDCSDSGSCPLAENPQLLEEIHRRNAAGGLESCRTGRTTCTELAASLEIGSDEAPKKPAE